MIPTDVLWNGDVTSCTARFDDDGVWIAPGDLQRATGWADEPHGLCRGDVCIPTRGREDLRVDGEVNLTGALAMASQPVATWSDGTRGAVAVGHAVTDLHESMRGTTAPDFTLPGRDGTDVRLDDGTTRKRMLLAFASW